MAKLTWTHGKGFYGNALFRIFREGRTWWLSDIRKGRTQAPSWPFRTAKAAKEAAERLV